jgi:hypothetical protein
MSKENECRSYAAKTMDLAQRASSTTDRRRLLLMTEAWLDLADRVRRAASHQVRTIRDPHPLVHARLIGENPEPE